MTDFDKPDPDFVSRLESDLRREFRRQQRFNQATDGLRGRSFWRVTALVAICLALGAAGAVAADRLEDSWQKKLHLVRAENAIRVTQIRFDLISEEMERLNRDPNADRRMRAALEQELSNVKLRLAVAQLDSDEIKMSGRPPASALTAPLIDDRDFVSERLRLDIDGVRESARCLARQVDMADPAELEILARAAREEQTRIDAQISHLERQLRLREDFLCGKIGATELQIRPSLDEAKLRLHDMTAKLEQIKQAIQEVEQSAAAGPDRDNMRRQFRYEIAIAEAEERLARTEVDLLEQELARARGAK
jgi:hypothetical protein